MNPKHLFGWGAFSLLLFSCSKEPTMLDLVILRDTTSPREAVICFSDLHELMKPEQFLWHSYSVKLREVCEVEECHIRSLRIEAGDENSQTESQRKQDMFRFLESARSMLEEQEASQGELAHSYLYYALAEELNLLSQSRATNRILLVESDLLENTPGFSVYRESDLKLLQQDPDSVIVRFQREIPLPESLAGIRVHIVHKASKEDHQAFALMSRLYTKMLRGKGASVTVSANL